MGDPERERFLEGALETGHRGGHDRLQIRFETVVLRRIEFALDRDFQPLRI